MCIFGGGNGGAKALAAQQQQQATEARTDADTKAASLRTGMANINQAFGGFTDDYFNNLAKNYTDYATPQLQDQYDEAKKNIVYALARKGNLASSTYGDQLALLDRQNATAQTGIEGTASDYANQARRDVQSNKNDVISQLNSNYDADAANASALSSAKALAVPVSFSPLGNLFTNISAMAAQNKLASEGNPAATQYGAKLFGSSGGSSYAVA
jgi:hypothetical protein